MTVMIGKPAARPAAAGAQVSPSASPLASPPAQRFAWKPEYSLGDAVIDAEHRAVVELAELLYDATRHDKGEAVIGPAFILLEKYVREHFVHEEEFFRKIDTPLLAEHRQEHERLARELLDLKAASALGFVAAAPDRLETWLEQRLIVHLATDDRQALEAGRNRPR
jgi:hemerythrin-like metal-binding protein